MPQPHMLGAYNTFMGGVDRMDQNISNYRVSIKMAWGLYSISVVILALNRCIEIHSIDLADRLFGGRKAYLWMISPWIYSVLIFSTTIDIPPIYNTVWSVYLFRIDFRDEAPLAMLQSFLICFFLFITSSLYAVAGLIRVPNHMLMFATISVQICSVMLGKLIGWELARTKRNLGGIVSIRTPGTSFVTGEQRVSTFAGPRTRSRLPGPAQRLG
uniref:ABC-2 type transporter domain-containing protein n=1 Tax=Ditylenchus dipsaci TaxID=166011 RepID=A0A915DQK4_9BILA